jgi:hypothetical protein
LHHIRNRVATERVLLREMREVVVSPRRKQTLPPTRIQAAATQAQSVGDRRLAYS